MVILRQLLLFSLILLCSGASFADVSSNLNQFFNGLGYASNASNPTAYEGQQAGYYTGGSLYLRNSVNNTQLMNVQLPSIGAGCGGIDMFLGGFSFVNGQGIKTLTQNVMHGAAGYALDLALQQQLPMASNIMSRIRSIANAANRFDLNSCHLSKQLVGAAGMKAQASQMNVCESAAISLGQAGSWTEAEQLCRNPSDYQRILSMAKGSPAYQALVVNNTNVAWQALQSNPFSASDTELSELLMTLSGSIIVKDGQSIYLPSQVQNRNLIRALLKGGQASIWQCDTTNKNGCLNPRQGTLVIAPSAGLENQVAAMLTNMVSKIETDTPLTRQEIGFLQSTRLPVYKMLNVQAAYMQGSSILDVTSYANVIAVNIVYQYLQESLNEVKASSHALQYPPMIMKQFLNGINTALTNVRQQQHSAYQTIATVNSMVERTQMVERMLAAGLSSELYNHLKWAGGIP